MGRLSLFLEKNCIFTKFNEQQDLYAVSGLFQMCFHLSCLVFCSSKSTPWYESVSNFVCAHKWTVDFDLFYVRFVRIFILICIFAYKVIVNICVVSLSLSLFLCVLCMLKYWNTCFEMKSPQRRWERNIGIQFHSVPSPLFTWFYLLFNVLIHVCIHIHTESNLICFNCNDFKLMLNWNWQPRYMWMRVRARKFNVNTVFSFQQF